MRVTGSDTSRCTTRRSPIIRFDLTGEHKGEFMGVPPTERAIVLSGQTIMRFQDGRVVERWTTGDLFGLLTQLGALPAPSG